MSNTLGLNLPYEQYVYLDDHSREVITDFQSKSVDDIVKQMPELQSASTRDAAIRFAVLGENEEGVDTNSPIGAVAMPFTNDWTPGNYILAEMTRRIAMPNHRAIVFPSPRVGQSDNIILRGLKADRVSSGDLDPLSELQAHVLREYSVGEVAYVGYSQGAMTMTALADYYSREIDTTRVVSVEDPALVEGRTTKELQKAFAGDGLASMTNLFDAVRDSGIPALQKAQGVGGNNIPRLPMILDIAGLALSQSTPTNKVLKSAMTKGSSVRALERLKLSKADIAVVRAAESKVLTEEAFLAIQQKLGEAARYITIDGYGHEAADNITAFSLVVKKALQ
jgi:pimeloyl-ACP methyl ester carboxylesterase